MSAAPDDGAVLTAPAGAVARGHRAAKLKRLGWVLAISALLVAAIALSVSGKLTRWMAWSLGKIYSMGFWGVIVMIVLYAVSTVALIPAVRRASAASTRESQSR